MSAQAAKAKAAKAEVQKNGHIMVQDRGVTFTLPGSLDELPGDAVEALEADKYISFIRELDPQAFEEWKRSFAPKRWLFKDIQPLAEKLGKPYGFEQVGESSASRDS